jgi:REP element-mobilizing transposase RayT
MQSPVGAQANNMANTYSSLLYHFVFSTKKREPLITRDFKDDLYSYMGGIIRGENGSLIEIGGRADHVHILARMKSEPSVAVLIKTVKSKSSKWVNERSDFQGRFGWQTGYGAFTVSPSQLQKVREYIRNQQEHHRGRTFQEEYIELLKRHGIEFDERYVWD